MGRTKTPKIDSVRATERLRTRMAAHGETCGMIAARIGCTRSNVSCLLGGKSIPSLLLAVRLEREYGIPCADWFSE
jgi:antitoxin component HigA of HigAB toxin-antitoxin module